MSTRFAGFDVQYTSLSIAGPGTELGEDTVPDGEVALVIDGDEVSYVQGDPDRIRTRLHHVLAALEPHCSQY